MFASLSAARLAFIQLSVGLHRRLPLEYFLAAHLACYLKIFERLESFCLSMTLPFSLHTLVGIICFLIGSLLLFWSGFFCALIVLGLTSLFINMAPKRKSAASNKQAVKKARQGATSTRGQQRSPSQLETVTNENNSQPEGASIAPNIPEAVVASIVQQVTAEVTKQLLASQAQPPAPVAPSAADVADNVIEATTTGVRDGIAGIIPIFDSPEDTQPDNLFSSSALPIDVRVPDKLRAKIWAQEYVDFGQLVTNPISDQGYRLAVKNDGQNPTVSLEPISRNRKITTIESWVKSFHIFVGVYTKRFPTEAPALMKYGEIVQDLAGRGFNWKFYDENFRYLRQSQHASLPWGAIHWELWLRAQSSPSASKGSQSVTGRMNPNGFRVPPGYCFRYHRGLQCVKCAYKHTCFKCSAGEHRAIHCNFRGPSKPYPKQPNAGSQSSSNTSKK